MGDVLLQNISKEQIDKLGGIIVSTANPLKDRFRALFTLRNIGGSSAIQWIGKCFKDDSVLFKHECGYCLGQMQDKEAIPMLLNILRDTEQDSITRHEAGEALGAIGDDNEEVVAVLKEHASDPIPEVAETCELALERLKWFRDPDCPPEQLPPNPFKSVDPTPAAPSTDIKELREMLLDDKRSLFDRYRAMFSLRNIGTEESVLALTDGLTCGSALFRHEVAYVLGQAQQAATVPALEACLADTRQHAMVRHECAEALGAIATERCDVVLKAHMSDRERVVRESCAVALDVSEHEASGAFQYADGLSRT